MEKAAEPDPSIRHLWDAFSGTRDPHARDELIQHYMPLAKKVALRVFGLQADRSSFDDCLQYARTGLIEALDRFDPTRGVAFEAYSVHRIRGAVLNGISQDTELAAQRSFWRSRAADRIESLMQETGTTAERASLQDMIDLTVGLALGLALEDEPQLVDETLQANPYAVTELEHLSSRLRALIPELPEREAEIVKGHYFEHLEFQVLAQRHALSKGRISQLHARAVLRLRELMNRPPKVDRKV